jgi:hypothetical protein
MLEQIQRNYDHISEHTLKAEVGVTLHGWLIRKDMKGLPTIFYYGGNAEEVSLNIEEFNERIEANFVLFNYRGYGLSEGSPSEKLLKTDAQQIYDYFKHEFALNEGQIVVMGRSIGSGVACHIAAHNPVDKTILVTPYESIAAVGYDHFPEFLVNMLLSDRWENRKLANRIRSPVLFLVAANDEIIHPRHARALYDAEMVGATDAPIYRFQPWSTQSISLCDRPSDLLQCRFT